MVTGTRSIIKELIPRLIKAEKIYGGQTKIFSFLAFQMFLKTHTAQFHSKDFNFPLSLPITSN
jgi:hypothetical protein